MQADVYAGFNRLYEADRKLRRSSRPACWAHARRKFFDLARISKAPIAQRSCCSHRRPVRHRGGAMNDWAGESEFGGGSALPAQPAAG